MRIFILFFANLMMLVACTQQTQTTNAEKLTANASEVKAKVQAAIDLGTQKIATAESNIN